MFFVDVAGEYHALRAVDSIVGGVITLGGGGVGEDHAARSHKAGIVGEDVAAHRVGEAAGLHMRAADVDDAEVAMMGVLHLLPTVEEPVDGGRRAVVV